MEDYARQMFCKVCFDVIDAIDEMICLIGEYDAGLPILKDTTWYHQELPRLRIRVENILKNWDSSDDDEVQSFMMSQE